MRTTYRERRRCSIFPSIIYCPPAKLPVPSFPAATTIRDKNYSYPKRILFQPRGRQEAAARCIPIEHHLRRYNAPRRDGRRLAYLSIIFISHDNSQELIRQSISSFKYCTPSHFPSLFQVYLPTWIYTVVLCAIVHFYTIMFIIYMPLRSAWFQDNLRTPSMDFHHLCAPYYSRYYDAQVHCYIIHDR